jgi:ATP-binding cassette subfamily B protein
MNDRYRKHYLRQLDFDLRSHLEERPLLGLWRWMRGFRLTYLLALVSVALGVIARTSTYLLIRYVVDDLIPAPDGLRQLPWAAAGFVGLAAVEGFFSYLRGTLAARTAEGITLRLRVQLYDHLLHLPFAYHDRTSTGDLIQRVTSDVDALRRFFASEAVDVGRILALFFINWAMMLHLSRKLGMLAVIILPFILALSFFFFRRVSRAYEAMQEQEARLSTTLQENLTGQRVVRAFARQDYERKKFYRDNKLRFLRGKRETLMHALYWPFSDLLCMGQTLLVLGVGAVMALRGEITLGTYIAVMGMITWVVWPLRNLGRIIVRISTVFVSYRRVAKVLAAEPEQLEAGDPVLRGKPVRGAITFEGVSFAYPVGEAQPVLHDLTFHVEPGQRVALLGATGSGKTTLVNLLLRFYEPTAGRILLDGRDLRDYPLAALRRQIGIVEQEPFLFSRTIRENLLYGAGREVSEAEMIAAAKAAAIHEVILSFPQGYETMVGEKGVLLSGGQRQRIAIARMLLKDPRILIFDAATSALDAETEAQIEAALERLMAGRTTFIIAHRIRTVMGADLILVLDEGRIVQRGRHEELLADEEGLYRRIYDVQMSVRASLEAELRALGLSEAKEL